MTNADAYLGGLAPEYFENDGHQLLIDVANWADLCTAKRGSPVQHPESGINNHIYDEPGAWQEKSNEMLDNRPANLPLTDLTIDHFFYAARALSGPNLAAFGDPDAAHQLLGDGLLNITTNLTNQPGDLNDPNSPARGPGGGQMGLHDALDHLFDNWSGGAKEKCVEYAASVYDFMTSQQKTIAEAADALLAYCSVILGARRRMINLMRGFVAAMRKREAEDVAEDQEFPWGIVALAVVAVASGGFGLAAVAAGEAAVVTAEVVDAVAQPVLGLAGSVADKMLDGDKGTVTSADYAAAAHDYLTKADQILDDARAGILKITQSYGAMESSHGKPPPPPLTKTQFDADHHQLEPEAN